MQQIILIGKTGSGKTALGGKLSTTLSIPHISSGDIARHMANEDEDTKTALASGLMAPEAAMRNAIRSEIERATISDGGYILDGFPRTVAQLIAVLTWSKHEPLFFYLDLPDLDVITRLLSRKRKDDNPDSIARKLYSFQQETMPLIRMLDEANALWIVDAARKADRVADSVLTRINRIADEAEK